MANRVDKAREAFQRDSGNPAPQQNASAQRNSGQTLLPSQAYDATMTGTGINPAPAGSVIRGIGNLYDQGMTGLGNGLDWAVDNILGNIVGYYNPEAGDYIKNFMTGDELAPWLKTGGQLGALALGPAGVALSAGMALADNLPEFENAVSGVDAYGNELTDFQRAGYAGSGLLDVALSAIPGAGILANAGKLSKAARGAQATAEAAEGAAKATAKGAAKTAEKAADDVVEDATKAAANTADNAAEEIGKRGKRLSPELAAEEAAAKTAAPAAAEAAEGTIAAVEQANRLRNAISSIGKRNDALREQAIKTASNQTAKRDALAKTRADLAKDVESGTKTKQAAADELAEAARGDSAVRAVLNSNTPLATAIERLQSAPLATGNARKALTAAQNLGLGSASMVSQAAAQSGEAGLEQLKDYYLGGNANLGDYANLIAAMALPGKRLTRQLPNMRGGRRFAPNWDKDLKITPLEGTYTGLNEAAIRAILLNDIINGEYEQAKQQGGE